MPDQHPTVFVLGLGYVGLPLAIQLASHVRVIGFEKCPRRRRQLEQGIDVRGAVTKRQFEVARHWELAAGPEVIGEANFVICAVPTPVDDRNEPDLTAIEEACSLIGRNLRAGATVVFESTLYPGATEEICVPILERESKLTWKRDFFVGYSPERVNPGDEAHGLRDVVKVVAGDTEETLERLVGLYELVIDAGVYRAASIRVAEAAKVVENVQRDVNIALMNELSGILRRLGVDTLKVLEAAGTKWNFLPFRPGLVGGHCVAVDPYYLLHVARRAGVEPRLIDAARRVNEDWPHRLGELILQCLSRQSRARVLVLGVTFKSDCSDLRNSKVLELLSCLRAGSEVLHCVDPVAVPGEAEEIGLQLLDFGDLDGSYEAIVLAVDHTAFRSVGEEQLLQHLSPTGHVFDLHGRLPQELATRLDGRLWRP